MRVCNCRCARSSILLQKSVCYGWDSPRAIIALRTALLLIGGPDAIELALCAAYRLKGTSQSQASRAPVGFHGDGHLVCQHPTAGHVHHRRQIDKAPGHGDVGSVQCPDLIGSDDGQFAQQIGVDLVARCGLCCGSASTVY